MYNTIHLDCLLCFILLAGIYPLGYVSNRANILQPTDVRMEEFRRFVYHRLELPSVNDRIIPTILIVEKGSACDHCHRYGQTEALERHIKKTHSRAHVIRVSWTGMPIKKQVFGKIMLAVAYLRPLFNT